MSTTAEYRALLTEFVPRPIRTEREHRRALKQLERLMVPHPSAAQGQLVEVISMLVEQYESRDYPAPSLAPSDALAHLMKARNIKCIDLAKETGIPTATLSNVLAQRRGISKANAAKLANYFGVSPLIFLA